MAGCGRLEDVGETRHAAEFARQVAERQQLQEPAALASAFVRGELIAQKRLQDSDPVIVRQVEQRLSVVITRQTGVRRGAIARADQLAADVLDAPSGRGLGPAVVDHDRRGVLGCDPRVGWLVGLRHVRCAVVVLVVELVGDVERRVVVGQVVLAFTESFRVVVSRDLGTARLVV